MVESFKDIEAILKHYNVKTFKVLPGEYVVIKKNGVWHYFNWSYKEKGLIKVRESPYLFGTL